jgi:hypothetical protein
LEARIIPSEAKRIREPALSQFEWETRDGSLRSHHGDLKAGPRLAGLRYGSAALELTTTQKEMIPMKSVARERTGLKPFIKGNVPEAITDRVERGIVIIVKRSQNGRWVAVKRIDHARGNLGAP